MIKLFVLLAFIFTSFMTLEGPLDQSSSIENPISKNKIFIEIENHQNYSHLKDNNKNSNANTKTPILTDFHSDFIVSIPGIQLKPVLYRKLALHDFHCIWII
ncbi:MAG: hypothetical protein MK008_10955 [Bdellovibrionales bacterium]|nr:hypothetical protein [Bdellovibrionales bacterium]